MKVIQEELEETRGSKRELGAQVTQRGADTTVVLVILAHDYRGSWAGERSSLISTGLQEKTQITQDLQVTSTSRTSVFAMETILLGMAKWPLWD